jgi:hypothetical protein
MSRSYPRFGDRRDIKAKQERRPPEHKKRCAICGDIATSEVWIQVSWFRGEDQFAYACKDHRNDTALFNHGQSA